MTDLTHRIAVVVGQHVKPSLGAGAVPADVPLAQLGLDSLATINLVLALEDVLGISFPEDTLTPATFRSVASIRDAVARLARHAAADR
jgi:acyl carrier protein